MKPGHIALARIILAALVALFAMVNLAFAHSWYTAERDPVFARMPDYWYAKERDPVYRDVSCCHNDCGAISDAWVTQASDGYYIRMTETQAQTVNAAWKGSVDAFVPRGRTQDSPDGQYHVCLMTYPSKKFSNGSPDPRNGVRCFWARVPGY